MLLWLITLLFFLCTTASWCMYHCIMMFVLIDHIFLHNCCIPARYCTHHCIILHAPPHRQPWCSWKRPRLSGRFLRRGGTRRARRQEQPFCLPASVSPCTGGPGNLMERFSTFLERGKPGGALYEQDTIQYKHVFYYSGINPVEF